MACCHLLPRRVRVARHVGGVIDHRSFEERRAHGVAAHRRLQPRAVQRHRFRQQRHSALRGIVGGEIVPADEARHRRQIDDGAAVLAQQRHGVFAAEESAVEIDRQHPPPGRQSRAVSTLPSATMPAALTSPSSRPCRLSMSAATRCQSASLVTSSADVDAAAGLEVAWRSPCRRPPSPPWPRRCRRRPRRR